MSETTIVLTGGIASGKSAVASGFAALGAAVFDADVVARDLVRPGRPALAEIVAAFGPGMLTAAGELDRRAMRERIFADANDRRTLEAILHPRVRVELLAASRQCPQPYCVLVVPLLAEFPADYAFAERVLVVDAPTGMRIARLVDRDHLTRADAARALAAQASREQRLAIADDVIDNSDGVEALRAPVARLHRKYLGLARDRAR